MKPSIFPHVLLAVFTTTGTICGVSAAGYNKTDSTPTFQLSTDSSFNFQYLTALASALTGGSDIGPVLGAAKNIKDGDMNSFSEYFKKLAFDTKAEAENPENSYDPINVRDTWFSTSQYFRQADFYLHGNWSNPLIHSLWSEQTAAFDNALKSLPVPGKRIRIPAKEGNFTIEAIFYGASNRKDEKLPTLVIGNGYDAAQEDSYHDFVVPALARGWNCITYEGPGQPTVRREQNLGFIPNWEHVVTPVIDYLVSEKSNLIDTDRLVLLGNSFGGLLAARAAAFESRLAATILIDGVWDTYAGFSQQLSPELIGIFEAGNYSQFDQSIMSLRSAGKLPTNAAWGIDQGLWSFNTHSPSKFLNDSKKFRLIDVVDNIKNPVFIGDAQFETFFQGQPRKVKQSLGDRATLHSFRGVAGYHCQTGAGQELTRAIFAWLNETLRNRDY
ncbi:hypothetical protein PENSTE_c021G10302 [Penicillium steckii]|uniref:AB hydrolase-1 domain-containing protein n=1 Tax=Penicillium steckii TaxID=303698 RepID=A0A1V6STI0_9EURO|nr:hypothetical protein PENSTE_c021G10302 [Penicillium steckii]